MSCKNILYDHYRNFFYKIKNFKNGKQLVFKYQGKQTGITAPQTITSMYKLCIHEKK